MEKTNEIEAPTKASEVHDEISEDIKDYQALKITKDSLLLSGDGVFGPTFQGEGPTLGHPCIFVRLHHCNLHCNFCLAKGTQVTLVNGNTVPIESLKRGDYVLGSDGKPSRITETQVVSTDEVYEIETEEGQIIRCSGNHEFFVDGKWIEAKDLVAGAKLTTSPDTSIIVPHGKRR